MGRTTPTTSVDRHAFIVEEIERLARLDGGRAPGRLVFERATGVKYEQWCGDANSTEVCTSPSHMDFPSSESLASRWRE